MELADEEFEVHGPRLNRYAQAWAYYLGHHWSHRRENGEPQLTFNYVRALSDFITNFCFGRGFSNRSPYETSAIVPSLLDRVWTQDNQKELVLWEMGNQGGVGGDVFVKVAYEEPHLQPPLTAGPDGEPGVPIPGIQYRQIPGRCRILVVNQSFVYPEWHPHDRTRLLRVKMKYRFWGNTTDGARSVFTYTELITDTAIEEYINDRLISSRPNPIGEVLWVHIPNIMVSGSPWGLSDVTDVLILNREYNEKATDVSDIVNYHAAPVTVMTGAKASQLEKGAKKMWAGLPKDAQVFNLELGGGGVESAIKWMDTVKKAMHELTGVPEGALGDVQPISNTSGVALAIQYQPMMNRYNHKKMTYGVGIQRINRLCLMTLALKEPDSFIWQPRRDETLKEGQVEVLDPNDPVTYQSEVHWPPPLPVDILVTLQEVQIKMDLGIMSKRAALQELGEEFPDEKMREIFLELVEDAIDNGALTMLRAQISQVVQETTGQFDPNYPQPFPPPMVGAPSGASSGAGGGGVQSAGGSPAVASAPNIGVPGAANVLGVQMSPDTQKLFEQLNTRAYGTTLAGGRMPRTSDDNMGAETD